MIYLITSIMCSVVVAVLLKIARKQKIGIHQAVAVNYAVAVMPTMLVLKPDLGNPRAFLPTWWLFAVLGVLLPSIFIIMSKPVDTVGIVKSDTAQWLSLFLPTIASLALFGEKLTEGRLMDIALASVVLFCLLRKSGGGKKSGGPMDDATLLLGVWSGYGVIDILFKQVAKSGTAFSGNLLVVFSLAAVLISGYLSCRLTKWAKEGVIGGVVLGCLSFANILAYIHAHQAMSENPTLVFASMNIGIIVLGTLVGVAASREKVSSVNTTGISVAAYSITYLFYWSQLRPLTGPQGPATRTTLRQPNTPGPSENECSDGPSIFLSR